MAQAQGITGRVVPPIRNFTAGELSPLLDPRADLAFYANGCRLLENFYVKPQGAAVYRPGTRFVAEVKDGTKPARLIRFEFSTVQAYIVEAGEAYFRFYKDKGRIESPPGTPVEISTPYAAADLARLKFAQSADTMYLVHPSYAPRKLTRSSHTSWSLAAVDFQDGPYLDENPDATKTLVASGASGSVTVTASGHSPFVATDVGRLIRLKNGGAWAWLKITGYTDGAHVAADVRGGSAPTVATSSWRLGLWSDTTGWPATVKFFEERLVFGGCTIRPQRIDGSKSNDFENFAQPVTTGAGDPIAYNIASDQVNAIRWLAPMQDLLVGTLGAEFRVRGDTDSAPITPVNISIKKQTNHGCADLDPVLSANAVLYVQRQGQKLREMAYDFAGGGWRAQDMTVRAEHIARGGIADLCYAQEPYGIVWAARADGQLLGFTYLRDQQVTAWHRHKLGCGAGTAAVENVETIPGAAADQLWMTVLRTGLGASKRYIEVLEDELPPAGDVFDAWHLDCALDFDGSKDATLTCGAGAEIAGTAGVAFAASAASFSAGDVGKEIRYRLQTAVETPLADEAFANARARITSYADATHVTATILAPFPASCPAKSWGVTVTSVSGLGAIGAVTDKVDLLVDGLPVKGVAVSGGAVALPGPAIKVRAGFSYTGNLLPMKLDAGSQVGTAQGQITRIDKVIVRFLRSLGAKFGPDADNLDQIEFRDAAAPLDLPPPLFSGDKEVSFPGGFSRDGDLLIRQDLPLPCQIVALFPRVTTSGG